METPFGASQSPDDAQIILPLIHNGVNHDFFSALVNLVIS